MNYRLVSKDKLTILANRKGLYEWNSLTQYVKNLPYGRITQKSDLSLVLTEQKGTCSSKHALLKEIADSNQIHGIDLVLCIFKMNAKNIPKLHKVFIKSPIDYIPEAHCYLKVNGFRKDFTAIDFDINVLQADIMEEVVIKPCQIDKFKIKYHKDFIINWALQTNSKIEPKAVWDLREKCILALSNKN